MRIGLDFSRRSVALDVSRSSKDIESTAVAAPALAERERRIKSLATLMRAIGQQFGGSSVETYKFVWQHQLNIWVYRCNRVIAQAGLRPMPRVYVDFLSKGIRKSEELPSDHPAVKLFLEPNDLDTTQDMLEKLWISWGLSGMYFFMYDEGSNTLEHLRSERVEVLPSTDGRRLISGYRYTVDGRRVDIEPERVIYGRYFHPDDDFYGLSPIKAATNSINAHLKATKMNLAFFDNACMPLGFFQTEYQFGNDPATLKQIKDELEDLYAGYEKFGETMVLGSNMKWQAIQPTNTEMQFIQLLDKARDEIACAYGVPEIFLNVREGMNYANAREHERLLWRSKMIPDFLKVQGTFDKFLNRQFKERGSRLRLQFDLRQIEALHDDQVQEAEASRVLVSSFQRTVNEARASRGEAPVDGGDVLMGPMSFVRLDQIGDVIDTRTPQVALGASRPGIRHKRAKALFATPEARLARWTESKDIVIRGEGRMRRLLLAIVEDWRRHCLDRLGVKADPHNADDILYDLDEARLMLRRLSKPVYEETMRTGGKRILAEVGVGTAFDLFDPRVVDILKRREQRFIERIGDDKWRALKESLGEGLSAGENSRQLADRVNAHMDAIASNANTIARTETLPCFHEGQVEGMRQSGVVSGKEWLAAFVELSRDEHIKVDRKVVPLDGSFTVWGEELAFPGAPNGRAENIINCLCDVLPVVMED